MLDVQKDVLPGVLDGARQAAAVTTRGERKDGLAALFVLRRYEN